MKGAQMIKRFGHFGWMHSMVAVTGLLMVWLVLAGAGPTRLDQVPAGKSVTLQGSVMSYQGSVLVVLERTIFLTKETEVLNKNEEPRSRNDLTRGQWVMVVGRETSKGVEALTIYLLPGRVDLDK
jgi:hypothetical protein